MLEFSELKTWYLEGKFKPYFDTQPERLYEVIRHFLEEAETPNPYSTPTLTLSSDWRR